MGNGAPELLDFGIWWGVPLLLTRLSSLAMGWKAIIIFFVAELCHLSSAQCVSPIYCNGLLVHIVQTSQMFEDCKDFVDMKSLQSNAKVMDNFNNFVKDFGQTPAREQIKKFISQNFEFEDGLEIWNPPDWKENPQNLNRIVDPKLKKWAFELNFLWKNISRKVSDKVRRNPQLYTLLPLPKGFIIAGGRFREIYYWDSYWIIKGLLVCGMKSTVKGILENFSHFVKKFGYIPNGGRIYYLGRSQPPLYIQMVNEYFINVNNTEGLNFLKNHIQYMDKEFGFWMEKRTVEAKKWGRTYKLCRYLSEHTDPRPESYIYDIEVAQQILHHKERKKIFNSIRSATESGWDFSSRWFIKDRSNTGNLSDIHTSEIIPVDLNAILWKNADLLSHFHTLLGNSEAAKYYKQKAEEWLAAIRAILWDEDLGVWLDYDTVNNKRRNYFYPSNISPLWTGAYDKRKVNVDKIVHYLRQLNLNTYPGGIPTSLIETNEQWDYPNAWPPLQSILVQGLDNTGHQGAQQLAFEIAKKWVVSNYRGYQQNDHKIFEKYNVKIVGQAGGGGEYVVQTGTGWSVGVILELLDKYASRLRLS